MKRVFLVFLAVLLFVPVLLIPVSADEVYVFEALPQNVVLFDSDFDFSVYGNGFVYLGRLPEGLYHVNFCGLGDDCFLSEPFVVSYYDSFDAFGGSFPADIETYTFCFSVESLVLQFVLFYYPVEDCTVFLSSDVVISELGFSSVQFSPTDSQPDFLSNCSDVVSSGLSTVSNICSTIANDGFLLLCVGFIFLGGCVGLSGRLLSRD